MTNYRDRFNNNKSEKLSQLDEQRKQKLFNIDGNKIVIEQTDNTFLSEVESEKYVKNYIKQKNRYIPGIDYNKPETFAFFGSAQKYYEDAIEHIYESYPYDGSRAEKVDWSLSASLIDLYMLEHEYPKSAGHIELERSSISSADTLYNTYTTPRYVSFSGGPQKNTIYNASKNRESNLKIDGTTGNTVEFWLKKDNASWQSALSREVILDVDTKYNDASVDRGRLTIELQVPSSSAASPFMITYTSGSTGTSTSGNERGLRIGDSTVTTTSIADSKWHHYAISMKSSGSSTVYKLYVDGTLNQAVTESYSIGPVVNFTNAVLGAANGGASTLGTGQMSGSIDEFRFWKEERTQKQIGENWYRAVHGGSDNDNSNANLGVYFKFNEGVTGVQAHDEIVLDYSGRINNGKIVGWKSDLRSTVSGVESSENLPEKNFKEVKDPIVNSENTLVSDLVSKFRNRGQTHDIQNPGALRNSVPQFFVDQDNGFFKELLQIMASSFDDLFLKVKNLPKMKSYDNSNFFKTKGSYTKQESELLLGCPEDLQVDFVGSHTKPWVNHILEHYGLVTTEIFANASLAETFLGRTKNITFEHDLHELKNSILSNIHKNLVNIYKSKGTESSFRNLVRCFGVDDDLIKLKTYGNNEQYKIENKPVYRVLKQKSVSFEGLNQTATIYQTSSSSGERDYITGSTNYTPFTLEANIVFPEENDSTTSSLTTSSLFGMHNVKGSESGNNLDWHTNDSGSIQVEFVRRTNNSKDGYFKVSSGNSVFTALTSSHFLDVYDNSHWNISVRVGAQGDIDFNLQPVPGGANYLVEFTGYNYDLDVLQDSFYVTSSISKADFEKITQLNKAVYVGAHRTNFSGSVQSSSDVRVLSFNYWNDALEEAELKEHAQNPSVFGRKNPELVSLFDDGNNQLAGDSLALRWQFSTLTSSSGTGTLDIVDFSHGDATTKPNAVTQFKHRGYGFDFQNSDANAIELELIPSVEYFGLDNVYSSDKVKVKESETSIFEVDSRPITHYYSFEKSMYDSISREMISFFAGIKGFNNLIGEPVNKYRQKYKLLEKMKAKFFSRVTNTIDLEKFVDYYRWIDQSLSHFLSQLIPASAYFSNNITDVVESHILERNKIKHQAPTIEFKDPSERVFPILGIRELLYDWEHGHAPLNQFLINSKSITFDGSNDHVLVGDYDAFSFTDGSGSDSPFSISAWIYIDDVSADNGPFVTKALVSGGGDGLEYIFKHASGKLRMFLYTNPGTGNRISLETNSVVLTDQTWHHVVMTYTGNNLSSGIALYVDGSKITSTNTALNAGSYNGMINQTTPLIIGKTNNDPAAAGQAFEDRMADVCMFDKSLSALEVSEVYNSGKVKNMELFSAYNNIISWWKMGDDQDTSEANGIKDYKSTNHGTLTNGAAIVDESSTALPSDGPDEQVNCLYFADRRPGSADTEPLRRIANTEVSGSTYVLRKLTKPYRFTVDRAQTVKTGFNSKSTKISEAFKILNTGRTATIAASSFIDQDKCRDIIIPNEKESYSTLLSISDTDDYLKLDANMLLPFNFISSSTGNDFSSFKQNLVISNNHLDIHIHGETSLQSPFSRRHVGGMPHRRVELGTAASERPEAYMITASATTMVISGAAPDVPKSFIHRDLGVGSNMVIRNIKDSASGQVLGNYSEEYELVLTNGRTQNDSFFAQNSDSFLNLYLSSSFITGTRSLRTKPSRTRKSHVIVNRFSGDHKANESLDPYFEEMSVANVMNYRHFKVRKDVDNISKNDTEYTFYKEDGQVDTFATASIVFDGATNSGLSITITSAQGTSLTYTSSNTQDFANRKFLRGITMFGDPKSIIATSLAACINDANGHNGEITATASGGTVTLVQTMHGRSGNTLIQYAINAGATTLSPQLVTAGSAESGLAASDITFAGGILARAGTGFINIPNRNPSRFTGSLGQEVNNDNFFVSHPIPQSDYQYSWITASVSGSIYDFLKSNSNSGHVIGDGVTFAGSDISRIPFETSPRYSRINGFQPSITHYNKAFLGPGSTSYHPGTRSGVVNKTCFLYASGAIPGYNTSTGVFASGSFAPQGTCPQPGDPVSINFYAAVKAGTLEQLGTNSAYTEVMIIPENYQVGIFHTGPSSISGLTIPRNCVVFSIDRRVAIDFDSTQNMSTEKIHSLCALSSVGIEEGNLTNVTVTYDGSGGHSGIKMYIDGVPVPIIPAEDTSLSNSINLPAGSVHTAGDLGTLYNSGSNFQLPDSSWHRTKHSSAHNYLNRTYYVSSMVNRPLNAGATPITGSVHTVTFDSQPSDGDIIVIPSVENINRTYEAKTSTSNSAQKFEIGSSVADTVANLKASIDASHFGSLNVENSSQTLTITQKKYGIRRKTGGLSNTGTLYTFGTPLSNFALAGGFINNSSLFAAAENSDGVENLCARFFGEVRGVIDSAIISESARANILNNELGMKYSSIAIFDNLLTKENVEEIVSLQKTSAQPKLVDSSIYADFRNLSFSSNLKAYYVITGSVTLDHYSVTNPNTNETSTIGGGGFILGTNTAIQVSAFEGLIGDKVVYTTTPGGFSFLKTTHLTGSSTDIIRNPPAIETSKIGNYADTNEKYEVNSLSISGASSGKTKAQNLGINIGINSYPSWKQIRNFDHPSVRHQRKNNEIGILTRGKIIFPDSQNSYNWDWYPQGNGNNDSISRTLDRSVSLYKEVPVTSKFKPLTCYSILNTSIASFDDPERIGQQAEELLWSQTERQPLLLWGLSDGYSLNRSTRAHANRISKFANPSLSLKIGLDDTNLVSKGLADTQRDIFGSRANSVIMTYSETLYPREENTFVEQTRERTLFDFDSWRDSRTDRTVSLSGGVSYGSPSLNLDGEYELFPARTVSKSTSVNSLQIAGAFNRSEITASIDTISPIRTSRWLLDSRETFSEKPRDLASDGYFLQPQDYLASKGFHSTRKEGEYQNEYSIFGSGINTLHGTPPPALLYSRRIPQVSSSAELLAGEAKWETPVQAGVGPFGNSYDSELSDLRTIAKDHSLIPEFKISDFIEDVILSQQDNNDMRTIKNKAGWLSLTGAVYHTSSATVEVDGGFYKTYSTSDFMKYFAQVDDYLDDNENSVTLDPTRLTLKCRAGIKFIPYKGLYPAERVSQIGEIFSRGYMNSFKGSEFPPLSATEANILVDRNALLNAKKTANLQQAIKPLMAPGVLMNSIKSGMAVDYPIFGSSADDTALSNFATAIDSQSDYFSSFHSSLGGLGNITGSIVSTGSADTGIPRLKGEVSKRVTFEDLLDPDRLVGQKIYDNEPHPSASIYYGNNALSHVFDYPFQFGTFDSFRTQNKLRVEKLKVNNNLDAYKLAINNFCAETVNFFLEDSSVATLESDSTAVTHRLPASTTYKMRIYVRNKGQQMYDRHSAFGPPVDEGDLNKTVRTWSSVTTGKTKRHAIFGPAKHIFDSVDISTSSESQLPAISVLKNDGTTAFAIKFYNSTKTVPNAVGSATHLSTATAARITAAGLGTLKINNSSRTAYIDIAPSTLGGSRTEFGLRQDEGSNSNTVIEDNKAYALISLMKEAFDEFKNNLSSRIKPYIVQNVTTGASEIAELNAFIPGSYPEATRYVRHSLKLMDTTAGSFSSSLAITYTNATLVQGLFDTTNPSNFTDGSAGTSINSLTDSVQAVTDSHEYAPFYPPFLDSGADPYIDISYTTPSTVTSATVQDILRDATATYSNFKETPSNSGGSNTNFTHAMNLAASLDLASFVAYDDGPEGSRPRSPEQRSRLVIQSKWETPIIDFTSVTSSALNMTDGTVDFVTESVWQTRTWDRYLFQTAQEPGTKTYLTSSRGMWHQFGSVVRESNKGYFLSVEDHPSQSDDTQLARILGFTNASQQKRQIQIGKLAPTKKISEAVVAVPFWEYKVDENSPTIIKWFNFTDSVVESARLYNQEAKLKLDTFLRSNADSALRKRATDRYEVFFNSPAGIYLQQPINSDLDDPSEVDKNVLLAAYQLRMMEKFIYPPSFDFEKNDYVSQNRLMYTFQFNAELSDEDLSKIWQNVMPTSAQSGGTPRYSSIKLNKEKYGITPDVQYLSHLLHTENFPISADEREDFIKKKVRWMLFKVKMKAQTDLSEVKINSLPGIRFDNKKIDKTNIVNNIDTGKFPYSFNWPYDYFSIVELVKFDAKVDFTNKGS